MSMFLSLLRLDPRCRDVRRDLSNCHDLHRTIMRAFPQRSTEGEAGARAEFGVLFRLEDGADGPILYVQSESRPSWDSLPVGYLLPPVPLGLPNPAVKSLDAAYEALQKGTELRFRLKANPARKIDTKSGPGGERRNGKRVPLIDDAKREDWLRRKSADCGFKILATRILPEGNPLDLRQTPTTSLRGSKPGAAGGDKATLSFRGVVFEGRIEVVDPEKLRTALRQGVGPGKAYGFGLLSIARA